MIRKSKSFGPLFLFYLLVAYVFLQCIWWSYHLMELNNEVFHLKSELAGLQQNAEAKETADARLKKRWTMIIGEASVFILLLVIGVVKIRKTFKKEAELARRQKNFLLSITHELRSPLASARLQLETLIKRDLEKEKQKEITSNCIQDIDRLNNLVENLLLAANIEHSGFRLYKEKGNLSDFILQAVEKAKLLDTTNHRINHEIQPSVFFDFDKMAFTSLINNLLENAIKYSPPASAINVNLKVENGKVYFSVSDEGIGIQQGEHENIFKKFYRVENEDTRVTKGTGLGLYIVKYLVDEHKGQITVKQNGQKGTIFEIIFPA